MRALCAFLLSWSMAWGAVGTLMTNFALFDHGGTILGGPMQLWMLAAAGIAVLAAMLPRGGVLTVLAAAGPSVYMLTKRNWMISLESFLYQVTVPYHKAYGGGYIRWSTQPLTEGEVKMMLLTIGMVVAGLTARAVCTGRGRWRPLLLGAAVLLVCMGVPSLAPDLMPALFLLSALLLLVLTGNLTKANGTEQAKVTGMLAAPVMLTVVLLLTIVPRTGLRWMPQDFMAKVSEWLSSSVQGLSATLRGETPDGEGALLIEQVKLDKVGNRKESETLVMTVSGGYRGRLYLRGMAYDQYTGKEWRASQGEWAMDGVYLTTSSGPGVTIRLEDVHEAYYVPCYPISPNLKWSGGKVPNSLKLTEYNLASTTEIKSLQVTTGGIRINNSAFIRLDSRLNPSASVMAQYLQLPEKSAADIQKYLRNVSEPVEQDNPTLRTGYVYEYAQRISTYVHGLATYDLKPRKLPLGQRDFAVWFMKTQNKGYCVHFATVAAVLLRAAGIPSRYVVGYTVNVSGPGEVEVKQKNAHAWVEYWLPGVGWMILDPTGYASGEIAPPASSSSKPSSQEPSSSERPDASSSKHPGSSSSARPDRPSSSATSDVSSRDDIHGIKIPWAAIGRWLMGVLKLLLIPVVLWGQWRLRVWYRHRRMYTGGSRRRAKARWKYCRQMARLLREQVPEELRTLTEKACYSAHKLTAEELNAYAAYLTAGEARLRKKTRILQVLYRLVFAVY